MTRIKEREVEWHPKIRKISQVPSEGLEFAFLTENYRQIHQLVWCKDFMQDAIYGHMNQKKVSIYGFRYDPEVDPPLYMDKTRFMLANWKDANFGTHVLENLRPFLNAIEEQLKMARTVFEKSIAPPSRYRKAGVYIANGSKRWMKSPPMISLYTLLLRIGMVHDPKDDPLETIRKVRMGKTSSYYGTSDRGILETSEAGLSRILEHGDRRLFHREMEKNYPPITKSGLKFSVFTLHDGCGLSAFSKGHTKNEFPHWHRLEEKR
jgi:hypothetical protein